MFFHNWFLLRVCLYFLMIPFPTIHLVSSPLPHQAWNSECCVWDPTVSFWPWVGQPSEHAISFIHTSVSSPSWNPPWKSFYPLAHAFNNLEGDSDWPAGAKCQCLNQLVWPEEATWLARKPFLETSNVSRPHWALLSLNYVYAYDLGTKFYGPLYWDDNWFIC